MAKRKKRLYRVMYDLSGKTFFGYDYKEHDCSVVVRAYYPSLAKHMVESCYNNTSLPRRAENFRVEEIHEEIPESLILNNRLK